MGKGRSQESNFPFILHVHSMKEYDWDCKSCCSFVAKIFSIILAGSSTQFVWLFMNRFENQWKAMYYQKNIDWNILGESVVIIFPNSLSITWFSWDMSTCKNTSTFANWTDCQYHLGLIFSVLLFWYSSDNIQWIYCGQSILKVSSPSLQEQHLCTSS